MHACEVKKIEQLQANAVYCILYDIVSANREYILSIIYKSINLY
jgi:hypothetical protein